MRSGTTQLLSLTLVTIALGSGAGCRLPAFLITSGTGAYDVAEMSPAWHPQPRSCTRPVDLALLRREPRRQHVILPGDVLGIYVEGVISGESLFSGGSELPEVVPTPAAIEGPSPAPATGLPLTVQADGSIHLPLIGMFRVEGMSLQEAADAIRAAYQKAGLLKEAGNSYAVVSLIRPRVNRILVVREDSVFQSLIGREDQILAKRGTAAVVELPEQHSDLLNALIATGGLPGEDARNDVWILRGRPDWQRATESFNNGQELEQIVAEGAPAPHTVIPLRYPCNQPLPFTREDVILQDGDLIFIEERHDYFYTGGLLSAGRIPLPRDEDIDILEAIAMANIGVAGPAGVNAAASQFRSGPGNVIPPTRAVVIRKLPGGRQVKIDVDLRAAMHDPSERILIAPEDFVMLHFRYSELLGNIALNFVNVGYSL